MTDSSLPLPIVYIPLSLELKKELFDFANAGEMDD